MSGNNVLTLMNEKSINGRYCYRNIRSMKSGTSRSIFFWNSFLKCLPYLRVRTFLMNNIHMFNLFFCFAISVYIYYLSYYTYTLQFIAISYQILLFVPHYSSTIVLIFLFIYIQHKYIYIYFKKNLLRLRTILSRFAR